MKKTPTYTPETIEDESGRYELDTFGDWTGWNLSGRRTFLKRTFQAAKDDVLNGRFACKCWPNCKHRGA